MAHDTAELIGRTKDDFNSDVLVCVECPTPIQWPQMRKHIVFRTEKALFVREAAINRLVVDLKDRDTEIARLLRVVALLGAECNNWREHDRLKAIENETGETAVGMAEVAYSLHRSMTATDSSPTAAAAVKGST